MPDSRHNNANDVFDLEKDSVALFQYTIEQSPQGVFWLDRKGRFTYVNRRGCESLGYSKEDLLAKYLWEIDPDFSEERWIVHWENMRQVNSRTFESRHRRRDGHIFPIEVSVYQVKFGEQDFHAAFVRDISDLVQAREKQARLEAQLQQARKLEAVGTLAGGVAHDFNNMLSVIFGYAELLQDRFADDIEALEDLAEIERAALSSRDIIRQLLAFSRRQVVAPVVLDINRHIRSTLKMLGRLIGEHIDLEFRPCDTIWNIRLDPSQLDQILVNLAVNARDAMPSGGRLTIRTFNENRENPGSGLGPDSKPGPYVGLSIADTGTGMDLETQSHVFEPFYSTKNPGRGTGLGLSTIYGIVKQNEGDIDLRSASGLGTTLTLYFPKSEGVMEVGDDEIWTISSKASGAILLVEDEGMVRNMVRQMLKSMGYTVHSVPGPQAAIDFCRSETTALDLLFTDMVMPGMNGDELSEEIKALRPGIKVLFMSGYTSSITDKDGFLSQGLHFIEKPFGKSDLAKRLDRILGHHD